MIGVCDSDRSQATGRAQHGSSCLCSGVKKQNKRESRYFFMLIQVNRERLVFVVFPPITGGGHKEIHFSEGVDQLSILQRGRDKNIARGTTDPGIDSVT